MMEERFLTLADGRRIALLDNGRQGKPLVIALHGWLDNGASFLPLAPHLAECHLVCIDLPGHGHSDHKPTPYVFVDWLDDLHQIAQAAGWQRFILLGHSLGALIASAYAGVFPEQIVRLILLEGLGPLSQPDEEVPAQLRRPLSIAAALASERPVGLPPSTRRWRPAARWLTSPRRRRASSASASWRRGMGGCIGAAIPVCGISPPCV